ncbi:MAG: hypothetical protein U9Q07_10605, partial [Planctomycetota bacterium]|nr:hypothetical protein [Planctomycetota bacterium]
MKRRRESRSRPQARLSSESSMRLNPGFTAGLGALFVTGLVLVFLPLLALFFGELSTPTSGAATIPDSIWASFSEPHLRALLFGSIVLASGVTLGA